MKIMNILLLCACVMLGGAVFAYGDFRSCDSPPERCGSLPSSPGDKASDWQLSRKTGAKVKYNGEQTDECEFFCPGKKQGTEEAFTQINMVRKFDGPTLFSLQEAGCVKKGQTKINPSACRLLENDVDACEKGEKMTKIAENLVVCRYVGPVDNNYFKITDDLGNEKNSIIIKSKGRGPGIQEKSPGLRERGNSTVEDSPR